VQSFGLFVELTEIYVQGLVHVSSMTDDYYSFNERAHTLKGENTGQAYRLGDAVRIQVARVDLERRQIDFVLQSVAEKARSGRRSSEGAARRPKAPRSRVPVAKEARRPARRPQRGRRG
jgi:ribonuclease R